MESIYRVILLHHSAGMMLACINGDGVNNRIQLHDVVLDIQHCNKG